MLNSVHEFMHILVGIVQSDCQVEEGKQICLIHNHYWIQLVRG